MYGALLEMLRGRPGFSKPKALDGTGMTNNDGTPVVGCLQLLEQNAVEFDQYLQRTKPALVGHWRSKYYTSAQVS